MSETSFQSWTLKYLNSFSGCIAENVSGNSSQSGRADINGCFCGKSFRLELKTIDNKNTASKKQKYNLLKWLSSGASVSVCYKKQDVKRFVESLKSKTSWSVSYTEDCVAFAYHRKGDKDEFIRTCKLFI